MEVGVWILNEGVYLFQKRVPLHRVPIRSSNGLGRSKEAHWLQIFLDDWNLKMFITAFTFQDQDHALPAGLPLQAWLPGPWVELSYRKYLI